MAKYIVLQKIGDGGFCEVHRCRRIEDDLILAKKTPLQPDEESTDRFRREVRILSKLDHPRIVKVIDRRLLKSPPWYVMPLYERSLVHEFPGIVGDEDRVNKVFGAVLEGMQYAHEQGVVHRDLKPSNILLNSDDDVVISDFGLGRDLNASSTRQTETGDRLGTYGYSAPEQVTDAKSADTRSDVFSLGRILYELYAGASPSAVQDLAKLPPGIAMIVDRCTRTAPSQRFRHAGELRIAFRNLWTIFDKDTDEGAVRTLLANATAQGHLSGQDLEDLTRALARLLDDTDLMHELCVALPQEVTADLWKLNPHLVRRLVQGFTEQVINKGWPFDYVDTIGNACMKLGQAIDDPHLRAHIAHAIVEVSVSHNRWHAMRQAAEFLAKYTSPPEDLAIAETLAPIKRHLPHLEDRISRGALGPNVAALFRKQKK